MSRGREIELKLVLDEGGAAALRSHPVLKDIDGKSARQVSTYYDTSEGALRDAGFSLRVREAQGRFVQTVKHQGQGAAGLFDRPEWEEEIEGTEPDLDRAAGTPLGELLGKKVRKRLKPLVRSDMERTIWRVSHDGSELEVTLDEGEVIGGKARERIGELELELASGRPAALIGFARMLGSNVPVRLGVLSKAERGYALADGSAGKAAKAEPITLSTSMNVAEGFAAVAASCLRQFRLNEPIVVAEQDAAALHQARVAMRRLRSAFSFFRPAIADAEFLRLREELRWFTNQLGEARNLDVLLRRAPHGKHEEPDDAALRRAIEAARERAYAEVLGALSSPRLRALMLDLAGWIEIGEWRQSGASQQPLASLGRARLNKRWRRVKKGGRDLRSLEAEPLHRLRIDVKKLRYAVEFLASLDMRDEAAARRKAYLAALEDMQEHLGELNDAETARGLVADLVPPDMAHRASRWIERARGGDDPIEASEQAYSRVVETGPFWRGGPC